MLGDTAFHHPRVSCRRDVGRRANQDDRPAARLDQVRAQTITVFHLPVTLVLMVSS
jgi:hypothetical protein